MKKVGTGPREIFERDEDNKIMKTYNKKHNTHVEKKAKVAKKLKFENLITKGINTM